MNKATKIRELPAPQIAQIQELYRLDPPLRGHETVVVSAIRSAFNTHSAETYIFGCDETGRVTNWVELPGSFQGAQDIPRALRGAGYEVVG